MATSEPGHVAVGGDRQEPGGGAGAGLPVGFVVTLADLDAERVGAVAAAIRALDGVVSVRPVEADPAAQVVRERADAEWREHVVDLLNDEGV